MKLFTIWLIILSINTLPDFLSAYGDKNLESFMVVWRTVYEKHWDLKGSGVDWDKILAQYKPLAEKAASIEETRKIMQDMLHELGQTHFGILGGDPLEELEAQRENFSYGSGTPGFDLRIIKNRSFVVKVDVDSQAYRKGIRIGDEILMLNDKELSPIVSTIIKSYETSPQKKLYITRTLNEFFKGSVDSDFQIRVKACQTGKIRTVKLTYGEEKGQVQRMGNLPPMSYHFESKLLPDKIGYVHFNIFLMPLNSDFPAALKTFKESSGLIIDIRGNGGGLGLLASSLSGYLVDKKGFKLGSMKTKDSSLNFAVFPRADIYDKPVAIIVDEGSASTSEIFAQGMIDLGRARVFGTPSAGAALPSFITRLPNGDRFQYAFADYTSTKGKKLEGAGVEPDVRTPHTLASMAQGKDAALESARKWINSQNQN